MYELLVGEIGLSRHEFLYDIQFWEARRIVAGHIKQRQARLSDLRLMAYLIINFNGMVDLTKNGITNAYDLCPFPWDDQEATGNDDIPSDEEIEKIREHLKLLNERTDAGEPAQ